MVTGKFLAGIFKTKASILTSRDAGNVIINQSVLDNQLFQDAKMQDVLGFKVEDGSDFKVVDVVDVRDQKAFLNFAFGLD